MKKDVNVLDRAESSGAPLTVNEDILAPVSDHAQIRAAAELAAKELVETAGMKQGDIFVVGCSSSEIIGERIGKHSAFDAALAVFEGIYPVLREKGIYLAAQCCEHLNRAVIVERKCAEKYGYDEVCVRPQPKAGGSFATVCYDNLCDAVAVENVRAHAGIDIGGTLIGMQLRCVAVPVRLSINKIGQANILCARTRPKYIGGPRAIYQ